MQDGRETDSFTIFTSSQSILGVSVIFLSHRTEEGNILIEVT